MSGEITGFSPESQLKDNWWETLLGKVGGGRINFHRNALFFRLRSIEVYKKFLQHFPEESPEGRFLKRMIEETQKSIKTNYGEILKP